VSGSARLPVVPSEGPRPSARGDGSSIDEHISLGELLDLDAFKDVCASFVDLYKIGIKLFDGDGTKLVDIRVGNGDWCGYIFQNPVGRQKCTGLVSKIKSFDYQGLGAGKIVEQYCFSGLKYVIMPITYGGDYLGRVIYGPFRPDDLERPGKAVEEFPHFDPGRLWSFAGKIRQAPDETIIKILNNFRGVIDTITFIAMKAHLTQRLHVESVTASYNELSETNQRLRESFEKLQALDKMKSNFLAMISHELRTPLTSVIGYSEMMLEGMAGDVNDEQREYLETIKDKGESLLSLIGSLLDMSKMEAGAMQMNLQELDTATVVEQARTSIVPQASKKRIEVGVDVSTDLPEYRADPERLRQSLVNLMGNAVKFTPEHGRIDLVVRVWTGVLPGEAGGRFGPPQRDFVRFDVKDTGIGIPPDKLETIFKSFYQVDNSITREFGGTGLGLSIVKRFMQAHGGDVAVHSQPGSGSTFSLLIPVT
jgi:two-component system, NarL family, sensor histidine kinase BarA